MARLIAVLVVFSVLGGHSTFKKKIKFEVQSENLILSVESEFFAEETISLEYEAGLIDQRNFLSLSSKEWDIHHFDTYTIKHSENWPKNLYCRPPPLV